MEPSWGWQCRRSLAIALRTALCVFPALSFLPYRTKNRHPLDRTTFLQGCNRDRFSIYTVRQQDPRIRQGNLISRGVLAWTLYSYLPNRHSFKKIIFPGVQLLYNVAAVSTVMRSESVYMYTYIPFFRFPSHLGHHRALDSGWPQVLGDLKQEDQTSQS